MNSFIVFGSWNSFVSVVHWHTKTQRNRERDLQFFPHSFGSRQLPFYELPRFLTVFKVVGWCCVNLCDLYCCWSKQDKAELASPFFLFFCSASKMWAWFENGVGLNSSQELSGRKRTNLFSPLPFREGVKRWGNFFTPSFVLEKSLGGYYTTLEDFDVQWGTTRFIWEDSAKFLFVGKWHWFWFLCSNLRRVNGERGWKY